VFFVCHTWSDCARGTEYKQVLCDGLWVDFDEVFSAVFTELTALLAALHSSHFRR